MTTKNHNILHEMLMADSWARSAMDYAQVQGSHDA